MNWKRTNGISLSSFFIGSSADGIGNSILSSEKNTVAEKEHTFCVMESPNPLVVAFCDLEIPEERRNTLLAFVATLNCHEKRVLCQWSQTQDFRRDIIGNLPLEITIEIFKYLELSSTFIYRRVSAKWQRILSSSIVADSFLQLWMSDGKSSGIRPIGPVGGDRSELAQQIIGFQTGQCFSRLMQYSGKPSTIRFGNPHNNQQLLAYAAGHVAWIDCTENCTINVLSLNSGSVHSWLSSDRNHILNMALSSDILAMTFYTAKLVVWEFSTNQTRTIRMPSADVRAVAASAKTVAVLHKETMTLWNPEAPCITQEILVSSCMGKSQGDGPDFFDKLLVDTSGKHIICFRIFINAFQMSVNFARFGIDGELNACGNQRYTHSLGFKHFDSKQPYPSNSHTYTVAMAPEKGCPFSSVLRIVYDLNNDQITFEQVKIPDSIAKSIVTKDSKCVHSHVVRCSVSHLHFWKNIAYGIYHPSMRCEPPHVILKKNYSELLPTDNEVASTSQWDLAANLPHFSTGLAQNISGERLGVALMGDENFVVSVWADHFEVFCFNKNVKLAKDGRCLKEVRNSFADRFALTLT